MSPAMLIDCAHDTHVCEKQSPGIVAGSSREAGLWEFTFLVSTRRWSHLYSGEILHNGKQMV